MRFRSTNGGQPCGSKRRSWACPSRTAPRSSGRLRHSPPGSVPHRSASPLRRPPEPDRPLPLAPSRPEGGALGPVPHAASPLAPRHSRERFERGRLIHALLQHLPALPERGREQAAQLWLSRTASGLPDGETVAIADETLAILQHTDLAPLFGPGSRAEVPLTGLVSGAVVGGVVDRLAVLPDRVLLADFKTNRDPPEHAGADTQAVFASVGGLPGGAARRVRRSAGTVRAGLDPRGAGCHAARRPARRACPRSGLDA